MARCRDWGWKGKREERKVREGRVACFLKLYAIYKSTFYFYLLLYLFKEEVLPVGFIILEPENSSFSFLYSNLRSK